MRTREGGREGGAGAGGGDREKEAEEEKEKERVRPREGGKEGSLPRIPYISERCTL